jgi:hypothetical protein
MRLSRALLVIVLAGCASESSEGEDQEASSTEAIIGGTPSFHQPAVGVSTLDGATGCSGSLVRDNVVLLAGHCFGEGRTDIAPWKFQLRKSATESYDFDTGPGWVKGRRAGADDLALIRLVQPVPPEIARPLPIARRWPSYGTKLQMIGFGCTERDGPGAGTKRMLEVKYGVEEDDDNYVPP